MIRGTTPTHIFNIPFDTKELKEVCVSYSQCTGVLVHKNTADCVLDGKTISVTLTQQDTLKFCDEMPLKIQLKVLTTTGCVMATPVFRKDVKEALYEGELL